MLVLHSVDGFTVTVSVAVSALHILVTRYLITAVPGEIPVTTPAALTVATATLLELHVPPGALSSTCMVSPSHTTLAPVITPGSTSGITVTLVVAVADPHTFVTVYEIVAVPNAMPSTIPVPDTVAIEGDALFHDPPEADPDKTVVYPRHNVLLPEMVPAAGSGLTVTGKADAAVPQTVVTLYLIVSAPAERPDMTPDTETAALPVVMLQKPPVAVVASVVVAPTQTVDDPEIVPAAGSGFTVIVVTRIHPVGSVYVISVVPAARPVNVPVADPIVPILVVLLAHVPPDGVLEIVVDAPKQTLVAPAIAPGSGLTVTTAVVRHPLASV
jgi:hypothetical protein